MNAELVVEYLGSVEGLRVEVAESLAEGRVALAARQPSLLLLDVWLQGSRLDGLELLDAVKERDPSLPVLMISGHGNLDTAVAAIRRGAVDFIEKPFEAERLLHLEQELHKTVISQDDAVKSVSKAIRKARSGLKDPRRPSGSFIFLGSSGVGKTELAKALAWFLFDDEDALVVATPFAGHPTQSVDADLDRSGIELDHRVIRAVAAVGAEIGRAHV